jgi:hypothetical protein
VGDVRLEAGHFRGAWWSVVDDGLARSLVVVVFFLLLVLFALADARGDAGGWVLLWTGLSERITRYIRYERC